MMAQDDLPLRAALRAVAAATPVARAVQARRDEVARMTKDDRSPVTVADFAVQAIVATELREVLGPVLIAGEEHSDALRLADQAPLRQAVLDAVHQHRPGSTMDEALAAIDSCSHDATAPSYWVLDPIDGTKGFVRGQQYAIALALIEHGRVTLGVIGGPNLSLDQSRPVEETDDCGVIYYAAAGFGAWELPADDHLGDANRVRMMPRQAGEPVRVCESVESGHSRHEHTHRVLARLGEGYAPLRIDSQCKYVLVARGQADAYLRFPTRRDYREFAWDHAAGAIIAAEAGAIVSDISGRALDFSRGRRLEDNRGIMCVHRELAGPMQQAIAELGLNAAPEPSSGTASASGARRGSA